MISHQQMLDMIATEAVEGSHIHVHGVGIVQTSPPARPRERKDSKSVRYHLRLVREKDGTLTWEE